VFVTFDVHFASASLPVISQVDNVELISLEFLLFDALSTFWFSDINVAVHSLLACPEIFVDDYFRSPYMYGEFIINKLL